MVKRDSLVEQINNYNLIFQAPVVILKERDNKFVQPAAEILCVIMDRVTMSSVRYMYFVHCKNISVDFKVI